MKTEKKSGKTLRKSGKRQGKIREFDGIKKVGTLTLQFGTNLAVHVEFKLKIMRMMIIHGSCNNVLEATTAGTIF